MNSSWKVGLELFLIVLLWKNLSFDDTRYKTPWEKNLQKNGKHFLRILGFHLLVGSRSKTHVHKGVRFPSKQVGFGQVLVCICNLNWHFAQSLIVGSDVMWPSPPNTKLDLPSPRAPWGRDSWPGGRSGSCTSAGPVQLGPSPWTWPPHLTSWVVVPRIGAMTSLVTAVIEEVVFSQAFLVCCVHFFEFDR